MHNCDSHSNKIISAQDPIHDCFYWNLYLFGQDTKHLPISDHMNTTIEVQFLLDTGASVNVINYETWLQIRNLYKECNIKQPT